jgi:hypothetical protein
VRCRQRSSYRQHTNDLPKHHASAGQFVGMLPMIVAL